MYLHITNTEGDTLEVLQLDEGESPIPKLDQIRNSYDLQLVNLYLSPHADRVLTD